MDIYFRLNVTGFAKPDTIVQELKSSFLIDMNATLKKNQ